MMSSANLPRTSRLTSTFLQDSPDTFNCYRTLQLLNFTKEVNLASDSNTPPVIACTDARSASEPAIMLSVAVLAYSSRFSRNFSLMTSSACMARSPNFSMSSLRMERHLLRTVS
jgi:hypothetical protein